MALYRTSSAPRVFPVAMWDLDADHHDGQRILKRSASVAAGLVLYKNPKYRVEVGIRRLAPGIIHLTTPVDELNYFFRGRAVYRSPHGETIEVTPGTVVHFKSGWDGECHVAEALDATYMQCPGEPAGKTPVLRDPMHPGPLKDWGIIPTMIDGSSRTAGLLLSRDRDGRSESGVWTCTPGVWHCVVTSDEFCHFLDGACTYVHESGERIEILPDTLAFFPRGWTGRCMVQKTIRKVYMIR